jgi:rhomboid domain-containing protein 1
MHNRNPFIRNPRARDGANALMFAMMIWQQIERLPYKPPVTLALIAFQAFVYYSGKLSPSEFCLNPLRDFSYRQFLSIESSARTILSPLIHADSTHLYYNMISFLMKGVTLEQRYGSVGFILVVLLLTFLTQLAYILLCFLLNHKECGVGFSGVIFALKVLCNFDEEGMQLVYGFSVPLRFAAWAELITIHFLVPRSSFFGHLAGILAGLVFLGGERAFKAINRRQPTTRNNNYSSRQR